MYVIFGVFMKGFGDVKRSFFDVFFVDIFVKVLEEKFDSVLDG